MKTIYIADDGKNFEDATKCREYEENLIAKEREKRRLEQERVKREQEVIDAYHNYEKIKQKYLNDYGYETVNHWLDYLFG